MLSRASGRGQAAGTAHYLWVDALVLAAPWGLVTSLPFLGALAAALALGAAPALPLGAAGLALDAAGLGAGGLAAGGAGGLAAGGAEGLAAGGAGGSYDAAGTS